MFYDWNRLSAENYNAFLTSVVLNGASLGGGGWEEEVPHLKPINKNNLSCSLMKTVSVVVVAVFA